jgi:hypothetical protein
MKRAVNSKDFSGYRERIAKIKEASHLYTSHSSLYSALFIFWQQNSGTSPFSVSRSILMSYSNIASTATYHKCMKDLHDYGYIIYKPSYHPKLGSLIYWPEEIS